MHQPIPDQGLWLAQVIRGYFVYHAVPTNFPALSAFRDHIRRIWLRTLRRRSQKDRFSWERMKKLATDFLPQPKILHPWPGARFAVTHPGVGAVCPNWACTDLGGGRGVTCVPTAIQR